jgi:TolB protein
VPALLAQCASREFFSAESISKGKLAFVANPSGNWELFIIAAGQTTPIQLTNTPLDERTPAISPDGTQIAYVTSDGSLWILQIATKQAQQLGGPPGHYGFPTWTKDGSGLVYTVYSFNPPSEDAELFLYSFKDKKQRLLLQQTGPQDFPALSPSGEQLAYMSSVATLVPGFGATVTQQLWVASLKDGKPQQLLWSSSRDTRPAWSPDGRWIAFSSDRNGNPDIWIVEAEQRESPTQLSNGPGAKTDPTWSPEGNQIAYVSNASGRSELMVIDVKTRQSRPLSLSSKSVEFRDPSWR